MNSNTPAKAIDDAIHARTFYATDRRLTITHALALAFATPQCEGSHESDFIEPAALAQHHPTYMVNRAAIFYRKDTPRVAFTPDFIGLIKATHQGADKRRMFTSAPSLTAIPLANLDSILQSPSSRIFDLDDRAAQHAYLLEGAQGPIERVQINLLTPSDLARVPDGTALAYALAVRSTADGHLMLSAQPIRLGTTYHP